MATKPTKKHEKVFLFWFNLVVFVAKLSFHEFLKNIYYYSHETHEKTRNVIFVLV